MPFPTMARKADIDANDAAARDQQGFCVYEMDTTMNTWKVHRYVQLKDAVTYVVGHCCAAADVNWLTATNDLDGGGSTIGAAATGITFAGIANAVYTTAYYGYIQCFGRAAGVACATGIAIADSLCLSGTNGRCVDIEAYVTATPTAPLIMGAFTGFVGVARTAESSNTCSVNIGWRFLS